MSVVDGECESCLANARSPMCKRPDCADTAAQLRRFRQISMDMRRKFAEGAAVFEASAYLCRAIEAEAKAEAIGTRMALAERALRLLRAGKPARREIADWERSVKEQENAA